MSLARRAARRDANEPAIVEALERMRDSQGRSRVPVIWQLSGEGVPDLLLVVRGAGWLLMEVKMPGKTLTPAQIDWWQECGASGPGVVVASPMEAEASVRAFADTSLDPLCERKLNPWGYWRHVPNGTPIPAGARR